MLSPDDKHSCLEVTKSAYQALQFYKEMQESDEKDEKFIQSAFGLVELMIHKVAEKMRLDSKVYEAMERRINISKVRNEKIKQLEQQISQHSNFDLFKPNLKLLNTRLNKRWNAEGFSSSSELIVGGYGDVVVKLSLSPAREVWDIERDRDNESENLPQEIERAFKGHQFQVHTDEEYVYLLDKDDNKERVGNIVLKCYPAATILKWETRRARTGFVLNSVEISLSNLSIFEEESH
jgi:hypothetical protein